ncbi:hypothetical protein Taro_038256 [Colocasia esculenta]|uniref:Uncharacterized protein n=1 Tax=Colocasia esculenta TaxID=4460 RepID=A0A843W2X9_COLES|nr:hypothetical protein [Colocasia esculenta]
MVSKVRSSSWTQHSALSGSRSPANVLLPPLESIAVPLVVPLAEWALPVGSLVAAPLLPSMQTANLLLASQQTADLWLASTGTAKEPRTSSSTTAP